MSSRTFSSSQPSTIPIDEDIRFKGWPARDGDWRCPSCDFLNFHERFTCLHCFREGVLVSQKAKLTYQKDPTYFRFKGILFVEKIYLLLRMIWKVDFKVIKSDLVASEFYGAFIVGIGMQVRLPQFQKEEGMHQLLYILDIKNDPKFDHGSTDLLSNTSNELFCLYVSVYDFGNFLSLNQEHL